MNKNDLYDYGLYIFQNENYFKFSLDSLLLAEFVKIKPNTKILDLCTGNAPIPLVLSTKNNRIEIDAVEVQRDIYDMACKSIKINNLENIIHIYNEDAKYYTNDYKYDIITCNPPYFKNTDSSLKNENEVKAIARHEILIDMDDIIKSVKRNLKETGSFYMVHRPERLFEIENKLNENGLGIRKICFIYTKKDSEANFILIKAEKNKKTDIKYYYKLINRNESYQNIFKDVII